VYFSADDGNPQDEVLVGQSMAGDADAFGILVTRYQKVMYTVALRMLGNAEDARDATQDAFVKAYRGLPTFDSTHRFYSWMYRILVNECLNAIRSRRPVDPLEAEIADRSNPFETTLAVQRRGHIEVALQRLTPEYRAVVVLRHFGGQSYGEIAAALDIPEKTVKSRLFSARQLLGEMLLGWKALAQESR
jgi:RNA polymerase sigma-70 factor (ECF subfamily)